MLKDKLQVFTRLQRQFSLRTRYLTVATLIVAIIFSTAWLAHLYVHQIARSGATNLTLRTNAAHQIRLLREALTKVEKNLVAYNATHAPEQRGDLLQGIRDAREHQQKLAQTPWTRRESMDGSVAEIGEQLVQLEAIINDLVEGNVDRVTTIATAGYRPAVPLIYQIGNQLVLLDTAVESSTNEDLAAFGHLAESIVTGLWALAFFGLLVVVVGYVYFEQVILKPIALLAGALKAEAMGLRSVPMPRCRTLETQRLIDAFGEMRFQIKERQRALEHQSLHDNLTGLANRVLLQDRLHQAFIRNHRDGGVIAFVVLNIDHFKEVNDSLGHHSGDSLLLRFCERMANPFDETATLARLGADEFAILMAARNPNAIQLATQRLRLLLEQPFEIDGHTLYVTCSIGYAIAPAHARDAMELMQRADIAMQYAKRRKSGLEEYNPAQDPSGPRRFTIINDLRHAVLERTPFTVVYQPQVNMRDGSFYGMEALLRWRHPIHGRIGPEEFITVAEQSGLMRQLTSLALDLVMEQYRDWRSRGLNPGLLSINLSVFNLEDEEFIEQVHRLLDKWQIDPANFLFEVTESAMMADPARAEHTLGQLSALGFRIAIDDFGTGFSSLAYLKRMPVSKLKIDKSFISTMHIDENDAVIVRSTIEMAHNMGLEVVAEGIDNREVLELLAILNCDYGQGFFLSTPLSGEAVEEWMQGKVTRALRPRISLA